MLDLLVACSVFPDELGVEEQYVRPLATFCLVDGREMNICGAIRFTFGIRVKLAQVGAYCIEIFVSAGEMPKHGGLFGNGVFAAGVLGDFPLFPFLEFFKEGLG